MRAAIVPIGAIVGAGASETVVKTSNSGPGGMMVFDPACVKIQPADAIRFVPADKGRHAELIKGMGPEGAPGLKTVVGKEAVTFDKPCLYGFEGALHDIVGMVGLIQAGDGPENLPENLKATRAVQHGELAAKRFEPLFENVQ